MTSVKEPESASDCGLNPEGGIPAEGDNALCNEIHESNIDATISECVEDAFVILCLQVVSITGVAWNDQALHDKRQRRIYVRFSIDPGNIQVSTDTFIYLELAPKAVEMTIPASLTTNRGTLMIIEIWGVQEECQNELISQGRESIHNMVKESSLEVPLTARRGKTSCGKIVLSSVLNQCSGVFSSTLLRGVSFPLHGNGEQVTDLIVVVILESQGLPQDSNPIIVAKLSSQDPTLQTDSADFNDKSGSFEWNHRFCFEITRQNRNDSSISLALIYEDDTESIHLQKPIGTATIQLNALNSDGSAFSAWVPIQPSTTADGQINARIRVTCCLLIDQANIIVPPGPSSITEMSNSILCDPIKESPVVFRLGSLLDLKLVSICATAPSEVDILRDLLASCSEAGEQLAIRGRLQLTSGNAQRCATTTLLQPDKTHCENQVCGRLFTDKGDGNTLRFELSPDVVADEYPQLSLDIRPRKSRTWKMALSIGLSSILSNLSVGVEYQCNFLLLDNEERPCGYLCTIFRSGLLADFEKIDCPGIPVVHKPDSCLLSLKLIKLQVLELNNDVNCVAKIWSSAMGKSRAQVMSPLVWKNGEFTSNQSEKKAVSLKINDTVCEILYVGIYRFSSSERNELIGYGDFGIPHALLGDKSDENLEIQQKVMLHSDSVGQKECESVIFTLQALRIKTEEVESRVSLAATSLGTVAYPVRNGEMKCRFEINILELLHLPVQVVEGDNIVFQLRVSQSNWTEELCPAKVVLSGDGTTKTALVGDTVQKVICWSPKDRTFPVLEIKLYVQHQRPHNRIGVLSTVSLRSTTRSRRLQSYKANSQTTEVSKRVLMATGSLNLCSFYSQMNVSVHTELPLTMEKTMTNEDATQSESTSLLATLRASSFIENEVKTPSSLDIVATKPPFVKGDVCIHLLEATGSFLRKTSSDSSYYVSISCGNRVTSSCCSVDDKHTLTWNQQLTLAVVSSTPPVIYITIYHRTLDYNKQESSISTQHLNSDQVVGYLTLPIFPAIIEEDHLLQLEVPFGLPFKSETSNSLKQNDDSCYHKRGIFTLEVQFLPTQQRKSPSPVSEELYELVIHKVRGNLTDFSPISRLMKHIFMDISLMVERSGKSEEVAIGTTGVISLSTSGMTEVSETIALSNPTIASTLKYESNCILVGKIRDLTGNYYGRVHFPLRKDWRERLGTRKKQVWYPICTDTNNTVTATDNAVLMTLQVAQNSNPPPQQNAPGKFYVCVSEVILDNKFGCQDQNLRKLGKYGGANVELMCKSLSTSNKTHYRTRQSTDQKHDLHWQWKDEWFVFSQAEKLSSSQELQICLTIGVQLNQPKFNGLLNLSSLIEDAKLKRLNIWITLADKVNNDEAAVTAHLHLVVVSIPTITGELSMDFEETYNCLENEHSLQVEYTFYKCIIHETTYTSTAEGQDDSESGTGYKKLRLPIDSRLEMSCAVPELFIQWMGVTKTLGEICLGVFSMDYLSISDLCCLTSDTLVRSSQGRLSWCEFSDRSDRTKTMGVAKLQIGFKSLENENVIQQQTSGTSNSLGKRVAAAEVFSLWKKLFYLLDQNGNGYIDQKEFTNVFMNHLDVMVETSDGRKLLQLLFSDNNQENIQEPPTQKQILAVFSAMDTNNDNEIEWAEYLRFLQEKQQQCLNNTEEDEEDTAQSIAVSKVSSQLEQKTELRKKNREDQRSEIQNTRKSHNELSPEETREPKPRKYSFKQTSSEPKTTSKASASEAKILKLQYSNQEQRRLQHQISSLESILALERKRYADLASDRQSLMQSYQQLHLKHQNELIQEQTKAKWMKQTIERQQQQLEERETLRHSRNEASIVLQSTVRSRLEQKRYQGLKFQRSNAATVIQCLVRRLKAKKKLQILQKADKKEKQQIRAALRLQKFTRFHFHRQERVLLVEARKLSAIILQKNARRMLISSSWKDQKEAVLKLQCWVRQRLASRRLTQVKTATIVVKSRVLKWFMRKKFERRKKNTRRIQRWWRRTSKERSAFVQVLEAVLCIQSAWKRRSARKWFEREWQRQETFLSELEATICIQAAWRGRYQRQLSQSCELTPRMDDDSVVEALIYSIVATIEAGAVDSMINEHSRISNEFDESLSKEKSLDETRNFEEEGIAVFKSQEMINLREEAEVSQVLTFLVEAVIWSSAQLDVGGDTLKLISPSTAPGDKLSGTGSDECLLPVSVDIRAEVHRSLEDPEFQVIRAVLGSIQDQIVSRACDKSVLPPTLLVNGTSECQTDSLERDISHDELNNTQAEAPVENQSSDFENEPFPDDVQERVVPGDNSLPPMLNEEELLVGSLAADELPTGIRLVTERETEEDSALVVNNDVHTLENDLNVPVNASGVRTIPDASVKQPIDDEARAELIFAANDAEAPDRDQHLQYEDDDVAATTSPGPDNEGKSHKSVNSTEVLDVDKAEGDFTVPDDSDPDSQNEDIDGGSSIDSADLLEADEMVILQDTKKH